MSRIDTCGLHLIFLAEIILTTFDKPFRCVSNDPLSIQGGPILKGHTNLRHFCNHCKSARHFTIYYNNRLGHRNTSHQSQATNLCRTLHSIIKYVLFDPLIKFPWLRSFFENGKMNYNAMASMPNQYSNECIIYYALQDFELESVLLSRTQYSMPHAPRMADFFISPSRRNFRNYKL